MLHNAIRAYHHHDRQNVALETKKAVHGGRRVQSSSEIRGVYTRGRPSQQAERQLGLLPALALSVHYNVSLSLSLRHIFQHSH